MEGVVPTSTDHLLIMGEIFGDSDVILGEILSSKLPTTDVLTWSLNDQVMLVLIPVLG